MKSVTIPLDQLFLKDKIAGKAAAALMVRMGIRKCHIELLSERAIPIFNSAGIDFSYQQLVEHIQCRTEDIITDQMSIEETYLFLRKRAGKVQGTTLKINDLICLVSGKLVLNGLEMELGRGEQMVIHGENGCGKTSLLKAILGLNPIQSGNILIGGEAVGSSSWRKNSMQTGYLKQDLAASNFPISVEEVVAIGLSGTKLRNDERTYRIELSMRKTGCYHLQKKLFHQLSGGEKQRVSLARCLCQNAKLLLLDEPTSFLDEAGKSELLELLKELSRTEVPTMLLVSHDAPWVNQLDWQKKEMKNGKLW